MVQKISHIFYGDETNEALDPDFILYEYQFLLGLSKFKGILVPDAAGAGEVIRRMIPEVLHCHRTLFVHDGEGSLEKAMLSRKSLHVTNKKISGRTLLAMAKSVFKNCKKTMAIVERRDSPYKNGTFPSGTNWNDYILWCLIEMAKEVDRDEAGMIDAGTIVSNNGSAGVHDGILDDGGAAAEVVDAPAADDDDKDKYPDRKYFKCGVGFIAWALWGLIPFCKSAGMQASAFSDCKRKAADGRNTESRAALRKLLTEKNDASVDNRRGKKRLADNDSAALVSPLPIDSKVLLEKTLHYMASGMMEIERQKFAAMQMRIVRDKLVDQRRKEDSLYRVIDRLPRNKQLGKAVADKLTVLQDEIASLVRQRDDLQNEELLRHQRDGAITNQQRYLVTSSSEDSTTILWSGSNVTNDSDSVANVSCPIVIGADVDDDGVRAGGKTNHDDDDDANVENAGGCIECNLPSPNHVCRKCGKCVCSLCCFEKRQLENVWWCGVCLSTQSVATQNSIGDGIYNSCDEED